MADDQGSVVLLNVTTWRPGCDENCIINPGEHSFVKHRSVIRYESGIVATLSQQDKLRPIASSRAPASDALVAKIQAGALRSDLTPQKVQALIEASMAKQGKP